MPRLGFESMTTVFEQAKTVYASDRAATVIGQRYPDGTRFHCKTTKS
jgi:hypothetical protein